MDEAIPERLPQAKLTRATLSLGLRVHKHHPNDITHRERRLSCSIQKKELPKTNTRKSRRRMGVVVHEVFSTAVRKKKKNMATLDSHYSEDPFQQA